MRIASLVPSATETAYALGLGPEMVAVTHECDHPAAARELPQLTRSLLEPGLDHRGIDSAVRELTNAGRSLYELDDARLAELEPDLILTQQICAVCAVSHEEVCELAAGLPRGPEVLSLDPTLLSEMLDDCERLATAACRPESGRELRAELERRIGAVREAVAGWERPRVAVLEWLDPVFAAGHWTPEMVEHAGSVDALASPGERSREISWEEVAAAKPDVVIVAPCGYYVDTAAAAAEPYAERLRDLDADRVVAVDAAASFSRPGPRLIDGIETLATILHPEAAIKPPLATRHLI